MASLLLSRASLFRNSATRALASASRVLVGQAVPSVASATAPAVVAKATAARAMGVRLMTTATKGSFGKKSSAAVAVAEDDEDDEDFEEDVEAPVAGKTGKKFSDFPFDEKLVKQLTALNYKETFGVQAATFDATLAGNDVIARAATGTGKTLAFVLPTLQKLGFSNPVRQPGSGPRAIILSPTRELASQIAAQIEKLEGACRLRSAAVYGGADTQLQRRALRRGVDIIIGTPGRVNDFIERGDLTLKDVEVFVLDEADEMLQANFLDQIENMFTMTKPNRQTLLFSATMPANVKYLVKTFMKDPEVIDVTSTESNLPKNVSHEVIYVPTNVGRGQATMLVLLERKPQKCMIFTNTKRQASDLAEYLDERGISAISIHGDLSQVKREKSLNLFRQGRVQAIVATDVAARGIDISDCDLVIQSDIPSNKESYVHRSGRTGRAGRSGTSILLCAQTRTDGSWIRDLEHTIGKSLETAELATEEAMTDVKSQHRISEHKFEPNSLRIDENNMPGRLIKKPFRRFNKFGGSGGGGGGGRFKKYDGEEGFGGPSKFGGYGGRSSGGFGGRSGGFGGSSNKFGGYGGRGNNGGGEDRGTFNGGSRKRFEDNDF